MGRSPAWMAAAVLGIGWILTLTATGDGVPAKPQAAASSIATVDLEVLFKGLNELTTRQATLNAKIDELKLEPNRIQDEMERINETIELQTLSPEEMLDLRFQLTVLNEEHKAKVTAANMLVQIEDGRINRELYSKALVVIEMIAGRDGIDLVLLDDQAVKVPDGPMATTREVQTMILARQILFATQSIDLTQAVITQMNNDYAVGH